MVNLACQYLYSEHFFGVKSKNTHNFAQKPMNGPDFPKNRKLLNPCNGPDGSGYKKAPLYLSPPSHYPNTIKDPYDPPTK